MKKRKKARQIARKKKKTRKKNSENNNIVSHLVIFCICRTSNHLESLHNSIWSDVEAHAAFHRLLERMQQEFLDFRRTIRSAVKEDDAVPRQREQRR